MAILRHAFVAGLAITTLGGCLARPMIYADAYVGPPELVYVQPGVQVVADFDYPVFYTSGAYWRFDGGYWYQSSYHDRAWVRTQRVPVAVRQVPNPGGYAHYRAPRDHRAAPARRQAPPPVDHRRAAPRPQR